MREISNVNGIQEQKSLQLTTTAVTDLLTLAAAEKGTYLVYGAIIVNDDTATCLVNLYWTLNATDYGIFTATIGASETTTVGFDTPIKLFAKDTARKIRGKAATANKVTITLLYGLSGQTTDAA